MSAESTTPDLFERTRLLAEAGNRRDFDAMESFYAPDAVYGGAEIGTFEGAVAIRGFFEDILGSYEEFHAEAEEIIDLGSGVSVAVVTVKGRPVGSTAEVGFRYSSVTTWTEGGIARTTNYTDIDEARAAAARLAESRG